MTKPDDMYMNLKGKAADGFGAAAPKLTDEDLFKMDLGPALDGVHEKTMLAADIGTVNVDLSAPMVGIQDPAGAVKVDAPKVIVVKHGGYGSFQ